MWKRLEIVEALGFGAVALACGGFGYAFGGVVSGVSACLLVAGVESIWYANVSDEVADADVS